ncbi:MAG: translation initiation factor IF-2, partial [Sphingomonadaceae bacterium]|nr:translation initiation factor IF-2 [Sphingomonadaceae bacterium]
MSDENNNKPTLTRKPLTLSRSLESGEVKQTFSHGRTNKVVVEVKRKKLVGKPGYAPDPVVAAPPPPPPPAASPAPAPAPKSSPTGNDMLSRQERQAKLLREAEDARLTMLEESGRREVEQRAQRAEEERQRAQASREEVAASPPSPPTTAVEVAVPAATDPDEPVAEESNKDGAAPTPRRFTPVEAPKRPEREREEIKKAPHRPTRGAADDRRQSGKLTVTRALEGDDGARARSLAALKRAREKEKRLHGGGSRQAQVKQTRDVVVPETITVQELANRMAEKGSDLVKALFKMGMPITINETIDQDTAELLVEEFGHNITRVSDADVDIFHDDDVDGAETMKPRPPVVTVMGHVDHGKTSLLDALRGANVVSGEAGGITQHIGAYQVKAKDGSIITFLDTPGHEAFTQMRQRGASVTDIVILVVAADDGLMPQTIEAIKHAKAANVPMIVAINKVDKEGANPQKVRERLLEHEVVVEAMGGDVQDVEVSALKKTGLDTLLEKLALQAEVMELKANPDRAAEAVVVEAQLDKGRGAVATVLVKRGTLKRGDRFVVGAQRGNVRAWVNEQGQHVAEAGPATPVEVLGLTGVPSAGDVLTVVENEARAREVALYRKEQSTKVRTAQVTPNLENLFDNLSATRAMEYPVVIKGDVQGSVEAIVTALNNISTDDIKVRILLAGVGGITESDMLLAAASNAPLIGFNVRPNAKAAALAKRDRVRLKYFDVIYHLTADIAKEMAGELGPEIIETVVGRAEVKDVFKSGKRDKAAGLLVTEGTIKKGLYARLTREDVIVSKTT